MASLRPSPTTLCHILWMESLSPSSMIFRHLFQMESISPFPILSTQSSIISDECKFLDTLVFNHLPPSDHKMQTIQSTSSGLRRLNRGSCCTPKFSLSYFSKISSCIGGYKTLPKDKEIVQMMVKYPSIGICKRSFDWYLQKIF